jgi:polyribonucleotide nucleotidyltransferase
MVESEAKELSEEVMLDAVMKGWKAFQPVIKGIIELAEMCAKEPWPITETPAHIKKLTSDIKSRYERKCAMPTRSPTRRSVMPPSDAAKKKADRAFKKPMPKSTTRNGGRQVQGNLEADVVRWQHPENRLPHRSARHENRAPHRRRSGRAAPHARLRPVHPRRNAGAGGHHAGHRHRMSRSSTRWKANTAERFMLHYNFPPYSVGETGRMGSTGPPRNRPRQAGMARHQPAATRQADAFPYTMRVVSEITESNGSSSMATVCGTSLSLMDAGVPLKASGGGYRHGSDQGRRTNSPSCPTFWVMKITSAIWTSRSPERIRRHSLQMDLKITSITEQIMKIAAQPGQRWPYAHSGRNGQGPDGGTRRTLQSSHRRSSR